MIELVQELNPVRSERRRLGWTIDKLAQRAGIGRSVVVRSERCEPKDIGLRVVQKLAGAMGISWQGLARDWLEWKTIAESDPMHVVDAFRAVQERREAEWRTREKGRR